MAKDGADDDLKAEDLAERLRALEARRDKRLGRERGEDGNDDEGRKGLARAYKVAIELVAGVAVGTFMGYWLDKWLGTSPLFLVALFALGTAAGFLNVARSTGMLAPPRSLDPAETVERGSDNEKKPGES
ncbi:MAG: AtpZ/AtpI family protein [Pseudomonadota bacterium]